MILKLSSIITIMKPLIIVESYTKTKTISKYLDNKYTVICSLGHINNLPTNEIGIDTTLWKGTYVDTNHKTIANIKNEAKKASHVYIASDPDMEGEAIAQHIYNIIKNIITVPIHRIRFHEITKKAITDALMQPQDINKDIVDAQESRRFVDRLVGYMLSPILWKKLSDNTLSVGRVQSVALLMCIKTLQKIQSHEYNPYWQVIANFTSPDIEFKLYQNNSKDIFKTTDKRILTSILQYCTFDKNYTMTFDESKSQESPGAPYTTTSLQQDAYNKFRYSSKKTMQLAQQLYENGLITYMRTDSTHISDAFKNNIIIYINSVYGTEYAKFRSYKNKIANAQEAHEAIRITNVNTLSCSISDEHNKLYEMIWKRTIACQMVNAEYLNICVSLKYSRLEEYIFKYTKPILMKQGYLLVYGTEVDITPDTFKASMNSIKIKDFQCKATIDTPPSLFNEIQLIKALEKEGIGRPSTYASIIDKLMSKKYVIKGQNPQKDIAIKHITKTKTGIQEVVDKISTGGKQKDLLVPTELGMNIISYLETIVPFLLDIQFTATMEDSLDKICQKEMSKKQLLDGFYNDYLLPVASVYNQKSSLTDTSEKSKTLTTSNTPKTYSSGIIKTKYGYCYYHASTKKYTNIESYLKWKNITAEQLQERDIKFLKSLPKKLEDETELHIGPYGLYIKSKNKNCKLDQSKWDSYI
jgi:DNA topoisomerase-1